MRIAIGSARDPRSPRQGAAAAEAALILPVLTMVVLGCVDFGRFAYTYIAVKNAARAGAAYGIMNNYTTGEVATWQNQIQEAARDEMEGQTGYVRANLTTISEGVPEMTGGQPNGYRRVRVAARYPFTTIVPWPGIPSSLTLQGRIEIRAIR